MKDFHKTKWHGWQKHKGSQMQSKMLGVCAKPTDEPDVLAYIPF